MERGHRRVSSPGIRMAFALCVGACVGVHHVTHTPLLALYPCSGSFLLASFRVCYFSCLLNSGASSRPSAALEIAP